MSRLALAQAAISALFLVFLNVAPAQAQATRTFVSGIGDDANPCSRTAACRTFAGAINKTAAGGQISVLDSGGFGGVMITKSLSIVAEGAEGSILVAGTNGIVVAAGPADVVSLRGLIIEGIGSGLNGIRFLSGAQLNIERCLIRGFSGQAAIDIQTTGTTRTFISDCTITKNSGGIFVRPGVGDSDVFVDGTRIFGNTDFGIRVASPRATLHLNDSVVTDNHNGLARFNRGRIVSFGNNAVFGNVNDGTPTSTIQLR